MMMNENKQHKMPADIVCKPYGEFTKTNTALPAPLYGNEADFLIGNI